MTAPGYARELRVDAYIDTLPAWQPAICAEIRDLVHAADPAIVETIKRTGQPYFVLDGNVVALLAARDHVSVFVYDPLVTDPEQIITAGLENSTVRQISIHEGEQVDAPAVTAMVREVAGHNRAGGWRKLGRGPGGEPLRPGR